MKGLELSKLYYKTYGEPMLREHFPELLPFLSAGLAGSGSECLGYDDDVSRDHDFEPGFCLFLPGEDVIGRKQEFALERAYARLPKEFMGFKRSLLAPVGGARHGVIRMDEFFREKTGKPDGALTMSDWLTVPEQSLLEAAGGEVFMDEYGRFSEIRAALAYFPEDIRRKKLAGHLLLMAQSGQYNYSRCLAHGETAAAQLAVYEFTKSAMTVAFLLNRRYQPYYKWSFRALRELPELSMNAELMEFLLTSDNEAAAAEEKVKVIEGIATDVIDVLIGQNLTKAVCRDLEKHARSVNDAVADAELRNMHILAGV